MFMNKGESHYTIEKELQQPNLDLNYELNIKPLSN